MPDRLVEHAIEPYRGIRDSGDAHLDLLAAAVVYLRVA
jgi:hypothetical protein